MIWEASLMLPMLPIAWGVWALRRPYRGVDHAKIRRLEIELGFEEDNSLSFAPGALWLVADPQDVQVASFNGTQIIYTLERGEAAP